MKENPSQGRVVLDFIEMKREELTPEQDHILRNYLMLLLMPYRKGRDIYSVICEANALYNCLFLLESDQLPYDHQDICDPTLHPQFKNLLSSIQRVFLHCIRHVLSGRTHETIDLVIADARHVASYIWNPTGEDHYLPSIDPHAPQ